MLPAPVTFRVALYVTEPEREAGSALRLFDSLGVAPKEVDSRLAEGGLSQSRIEYSRSAIDGNQDY